MKKEIVSKTMKVFAVGGAAAGLSALAFGLIATAVNMLMHIPKEAGYKAVGLFMLAGLALASALCVVYFCGCWIVKKGKFST